MFPNINEVFSGFSCGFKKKKKNSKVCFVLIPSQNNTQTQENWLNPTEHMDMQEDKRNKYSWKQQGRGIVLEKKA